MNNFLLRYNLESAQVKLIISGNSVVFEDLKISSGFFCFFVFFIISALRDDRLSVLHLH